MNIPALITLPKVQNEDFPSIVSRQNLPVSSSNINRETMNAGGFAKCLTYQMAMAGGVDRAFAENREENPVSNAPQAAIAASDDLLNQDSVSLVRCLTYQMAMAAEIDRQTIFQRQILRLEIKGLLDT
jgi:hypothetical protein